MKVLILDDEPPARRGLKAALNDIGVTDVRDVGTVDLALQAIIEERPDVLLLDVELRGGKKSFDLLNALPVDGIPVIFITAHPEHAVRAFEVDAIDYLLKPVDPQRLKQSLKRVSGAGSNEERPFTRDEKALFRDGSKNILLRVGDIQVLEASEAVGSPSTAPLRAFVTALIPISFFPLAEAMRSTSTMSPMWKTSREAS